WRTGESGDPVFWRRWTDAVMAHPVRALVLVVPFLLLLASPLLAIRTYNRGLEQLPPGAEVRQATEQAQRLVGPGFAGPVLVLLVLLRSVLLPLKAIAMNLLSVGAAYGVLVAVFQWGWLDWIGYSSPGHIDTIVPALVLAVTFGLSMDYEVFLLTRIRERYA